MPTPNDKNRELLKMYITDNFTSVEELAEWVAYVVLVDDREVDATLDVFREMEEELVEEELMEEVEITEFEFERS